jgi:hypothetical protein
VLQVLALSGVFVVVLLVNILKGGGAFASPLGITCGSIAFWLSTVFILVWLLVVSFWVRQHLIQQWLLKKKVSGNCTQLNWLSITVATSSMYHYVTKASSRGSRKTIVHMAQYTLYRRAMRIVVQQMAYSAVRLVVFKTMSMHSVFLHEQLKLYYTWHCTTHVRTTAQCGYRYVEGDVEWSPEATIKYPSLCFFAGFFAGLFGIGGGIVKGNSLRIYVTVGDSPL